MTVSRRYNVGIASVFSRWALAGLALAVLTGCVKDETISGYTDPGTTWRLVEMDGQPFPARATLRFPEEGRVEGVAPCNRFSARQTAPYPWIALGPIAATRRACPELEAEAAFFAALEAMGVAEALGGTLILSNEAGREMVFERVSAPE